MGAVFVAPEQQGGSHLPAALGCALDGKGRVTVNDDQETSLPGVWFSENLKETAAIADRITVIRSMTHGEAAHERGTHNMFTGYRPSPALQYPSMGSVVAHEFGPRNNLPPYVCIPNQPNEYAGTGYLSSSYAGFSLGSDPADGNFTAAIAKVTIFFFFKKKL